MTRLAEFAVSDVPAEIPAWLVPQHSGPSVLIVTASLGGGHDGPARELAARFRARGSGVTVVDLMGLAPFGAKLRRAFRTLLIHQPSVWRQIYQRSNGAARLPASIEYLIDRTGRRLAEIAASVHADLVITTYPLGGRVVEAARRHCALRLPLTTYLTDPAIHRLWLDNATDRYLTTWDFTAAELRERTSVDVELCAPAVRPEFALGCTNALTRHRRIRLGLPVATKLALVSSGSWGVGDVLGTVRDVASSAGVTPVVACGQNGRLREAAAQIPGAVAIGWIDDMAALMQACDVAVLNSGGLTLAEAAVCQLPVVHSRPLAGQGQLNATICAAYAGVPVVNSDAALGAAITAAHSITSHLGTRDPVLSALEVLSPAAAYRKAWSESSTSADRVRVGAA